MGLLFELRDGFLGGEEVVGDFLKHDYDIVL